MGIQEKKAMRAIGEYMDKEGLDAMKTACSNRNLSHELVVDESLDAQQIDVVGSNVKEFVSAFIETCEDADYKEEISKLERVVLHAKSGVERNKDHYLYGELTLDGQTLTVGMDGEHSLSNGATSNLVKFIKSLY